MGWLGGLLLGLTTLVTAHAETTSTTICQPSDEQIYVASDSPCRDRDLLLSALGELWTRGDLSTSEVLDAAWIERRQGLGEFDLMSMDDILLDGPWSLLDCGEVAEDDLCAFLRTRGLAVDDVHGRERTAAQLEARFPEMIQWASRCVRAAMPHSAGRDQIERMSLAAHDWRSGRFGEALERLHAARRKGSSERSDYEVLRDAMSDRPPTIDTTKSDWVIRRQRPGLKGEGGYIYRLHPSRMRAIRWLSMGRDADAERELLFGQWRSNFYNRSADDVGNLMLYQLLRERHGTQNLRDAWSRAEASIEIDADGARWTFLGQVLPLPHAVTCWTKDRREYEVTIDKTQILKRLRTTDFYWTLIGLPKASDLMRLVDDFKEECQGPVPDSAVALDRQFN